MSSSHLYFADGGVSTRCSPYLFSPGISRDWAGAYRKWTCFYCSSTNSGNKCRYCNAPKREKTLASIWAVNASPVNYTYHKSFLKKVKDFFVKLLS